MVSAGIKQWLLLKADHHHPVGILQAPSPRKDCLHLDAPALRKTTWHRMVWWCSFSVMDPGATLSLQQCLWMVMQVCMRDMLVQGGSRAKWRLRMLDESRMDM